MKRSKTSTPSSSSASKYPSGTSDDPTTSPSRLKKLEFSFSSELMQRTKRWRATLQREPSTELSTDDLPVLFKVFPSAVKLLTSIRADFRSCLTLYCRLVIPTNRFALGFELNADKPAHDPNAPHRALSELISRMGADIDSMVPSIPDMMMDVMPLRYKRIVKRDVAFASAFRDQRTKFIEEVQQSHISYTEQRVSAENIRRRIQELEHDMYDETVACEDLYVTRDKLAADFAIHVLQLHIVVLGTIIIQASIGPIIAPLLETDSPESMETTKEAVNAETAKSRALIASLQSNLLTLN